MTTDQPLILAVDTSTSCSAVALTRGSVTDGEVVASVVLNSKVTHSRRLLSGVDWILGESGVEFADIDGLAVGLGPGSFTGLRIAMATVKGLATAMNLPLLGVSTLDALALCCSGDKPLCVVLDARKKELYRCWYQPDGRGIYRSTGEIAAVSAEALIDEITEPSLLAGDGLFSYGQLLKEQLGEKMTCAPLPLHYPTAAALGFLSCEQLQRGEELDIDAAVPLYVRASDAELSLVNKEKQEQQQQQ